jgi:ABC-type antimicrobial peptide transport system permease subunit
VVLRDTVALLAIGIGAGVALAIGCGRFVESVVYNVTPADPLSIALAVVVMSAAGLLAGWLPARRATRIEPTVALRCE